MKTDYFPEIPSLKYQARTSLSNISVEFEDGGSAEIKTVRPSLWAIEFKGLKQPDTLKGTYTSIDHAQRALRFYLDKEGIEFKAVHRAVAHDDHPYHLPPNIC